MNTRATKTIKDALHIRYMKSVFLISFNNISTSSFVILLRTHKFPITFDIHCLFKSHILYLSVIK